MRPTNASRDDDTATLLEQARSGNLAAWDAVFGTYLRPLRKFAARQMPAVVAATTSAEDVVQDALVKAIAQLDRFEFRHRDAFLIYLRTSVRNRIIDELRRVRRRPGLVPLTDHATAELSPLQRLIGKQNAYRYAAAKAALRDRDRQLIALRVEEQLGYSDVAARLGIASGDAARVAVRRAIDRLARGLTTVESGETSSRARPRMRSLGVRRSRTSTPLEVMAG